MEELSVTTTTLLVFLTSLVAVYVGRWIWNMLNTRGPWGLPILGYYPLLRKDFHVQLQELSKTYGDAYQINILGQNCLYLNNMSAMKEVNVTKADYFASRGQKSSYLHDSLENGILFLEGEHWRVQRKFFVQAMREIGLARSDRDLGGPIADAVTATLEAFNESRGEPLDVISLMIKQSTDIVISLLLGGNISEETVQRINILYTAILAPITGKRMIVIGDRAKKLVMSRDKCYIDMMASTEELTHIFTAILEDHKQAFDADQTTPRDFIDAFLLEKATKEKKGDPQAKYYTDSCFLPTVVQAYGDGSVSIGLFVALLYRTLSFKKDIQEELYEEIVKTVGHERLPTWDDRLNLPLVNSAIKEALRLLDFATVFPGLECSKETTVMGMKVPEGTMAIMNFWAANHDPRVYDNPEHFDIRRFVPGKAQPDPVVFGMGKRACAGEGLVMVELFLFVAAVIQNFVLEPDIPGDEDKDLSFEEIMQKKVRAIPRPGGRFSTEL